MKIGAVGVIGPVNENFPVVGLKFGIGVGTQFSIGTDTYSSGKDYDNTLVMVDLGVDLVAGAAPIAGVVVVREGVSKVPMKAAPGHN